jgi:hypothetical protein
VELEKGVPSHQSKGTDHHVAKQNDTDAKMTNNKEPDDLEMIGGTSEDDFSEAIALVRFGPNRRLVDGFREKELLFGGQSLLARYGPLLVEVCSKPESYKVWIRRDNKNNSAGYRSPSCSDLGAWKVHVCLMYDCPSLMTCWLMLLKLIFAMPNSLCSSQLWKGPKIQLSAATLSSHWEIWFTSSPQHGF